jgi:K+ transporter
VPRAFIKGTTKNFNLDNKEVLASTSYILKNLLNITILKYILFSKKEKNKDKEKKEKS